MYTHMYTLFIYVFSLSLSISLSLYIYIYTYISLCTYLMLQPEGADYRVDGVRQAL